MIDRSRWAHLVVILAGPLAVLVALAYVARNAGFGRGDIPGFAFWSAILVIPLILAFRSAARFIATLRSSARASFGLLLGALCGVLFTIALALGMGPWIGAFSFPILYIWMASAALSLSAASLLLMPPPVKPTLRDSLRWTGITLLSFLMVGILPVGLVLGSTFIWGRAQREVYLVPGAFEGPVFVVFDQPTGHPLPIVDGQRVIQVPPSGVVVTSSPIAEGWKKPDVVRVQNGGSRVHVATDWARMDTVSTSVHTHWLSTRIGGTVNGLRQPTMRYEAFTLGRHDKEQGLEERADAVLDSLWKLYAR